MRLKLFMIEVTKCPLALIFGKNASNRSFDLVLVIHVVQNRHGWRETDTLVLLLTLAPLLIHKMPPACRVMKKYHTNIISEH